MSIAESLLPEFDQEMTATRQLLERLPQAEATWKPHPKSWSLSQLAVHIANLPQWATMTLQQTELDIHPPDGSSFPSPKYESVPALLTMFDENAKQARAAIAGTSDRDFLVPWTLKNGGAPVFTLPRVAVVRSFVMNHLIHHRGQYTVYLRLRNVPLPPIYGPTADEPM